MWPTSSNAHHCGPAPRSFLQSKRPQFLYQIAVGIIFRKQISIPEWEKRITKFKIHKTPTTIPTGHSPSWEADSHWASQEIPWLLWNPKVHYREHKGPPLVLTWARWIQSTPPHPIFLISILLLMSRLRLHLPVRFSDQNSVYISHLSHAYYMSLPSRPPWFDHPNIIWWSVQLWSSSLCSLLQPPAISSVLGPDILLSTVFSDFFNLSSYFSVRDQVSQRYKTAGKTVVLCILILKFLDSKRED
jgi:hypothetical protein